MFSTNKNQQTIIKIACLLIFSFIPYHIGAEIRSERLFFITEHNQNPIASSSGIEPPPAIKPSKPSRKPQASSPTKSFNNAPIIANPNQPVATGLTEDDVLDIDPYKEITEEDIQEALLQNKRDLSLPVGTSVILVQSGQQIPDLSLQNQLLRHYRLSTYPGFPFKKKRIVRRNEPAANQNSFIKVLRLAAARGGQRSILVFWTNLQAGIEKNGVYWVNLYNNELFRGTKMLRHLIRIAIIDVASGQWTIYSPPLSQEVPLVMPENRVRLFYKSTGSNISDISIPEQIEEVKTQSYADAVNDLIMRFSR